MNGNPRANGPRGHDPYAALRLVALIAAVTGVIVLAAAAFVLSYGGIHKIALSAGVSASMARIFPVIFDAMLVVSCAAVLSLRAANWWHRTYAWLTALVLLAAVAAADAVHATGTHIPRKPAAATIAVLPWVLLLVAFSLLLSMLRQFRRARAAGASQDATETAGLATPERHGAAPHDAAPDSTAPDSTAPDSTAPDRTAPESPGAGHTAVESTAVENAAADHTGPGTAGSAAAIRTGLDILEPGGPSPQPALAQAATQPSGAHPARMTVDTVPARESAPPLARQADTVPVDTVPAARMPSPPAPEPAAQPPATPPPPPRRPPPRRAP